MKFADTNYMQSFLCPPKLACDNIYKCTDIQIQRRQTQTHNISMNLCICDRILENSRCCAKFEFYSEIDCCLAYNLVFESMKLCIALLIYDQFKSCSRGCQLLTKTRFCLANESYTNVCAIAPILINKRVNTRHIFVYNCNSIIAQHLLFSKIRSHILYIIYINILISSTVYVSKYK